MLYYDLSNEWINCYGVDVMTEPMKSSQQVIKEANMKVVFNLINKHGEISRADIKKITHLSATTVSTLVEELIRDGYVCEGGIKTTHTSGRKAVLLHVRPDGGYFIGLDIEKNMVIADTYGLDFSTVFHTVVPVKSEEKLASAILRAVRDAAGDRNILGITMGLPAVIDASTNTVIASTVLNPEDSVNLYQTVLEAFPSTKITIKNNSGLIAYAEKEYGGHGKVRNLISIDIDKGVGAGIILDGVILNGSYGMAGEFGHISVDYTGKRCKCGNYGCLELMASIPAVLEKTNSSSMDELVKKLDNGDKVLLDIIDDTAKVLAFGINNIVNIIDPELIVIGGPIRALGDYLLAPIKSYMEEIALIGDKVVEFSSLTKNAVTLGGARVLFDEMFGL